MGLLNNSRKSAVIFLSLVLSLSLVACGKKGKKPEINTKPTTESPAETQAAVEPAQDNGVATTDDSKLTSGSEEDRNLIDLIEDQFETGSRRIPGDRPIIVEDNYNAPVSPELMSPSNLLPDELFAMNDSSYTGAKDRSGLFYTGAGQDNLLSLLVADMDSRESERDQTADLALARKLHQFKVIKGLGSNRLKVQFLIWNSSNGKVATEYIYTGALNESRVAYLNPTADCPDDFTVKVTCMDADGGCRVRVVKLIEKSATQGKAFVVDRHTRGHIYLAKPTSAYPFNGAYWAWYNVARNTELYLLGQTRRELPQFTQLTMKSSAVVNGEGSLRAFIRVERKNGTEELVTINSPMIKGQSSSQVGRSLMLTPVRTYDSSGRKINLGESYMGTLRHMSLVDNDGRGNFRFEFTAKSRQDAHAETFKFSLLREHVQPDYSRLRTAVQN